MIRRLAHPDAVALVGSLIGLASVPAGWLTLKPNRLASGASFTLWQSPGLVWAILFTALALLCLCLTLVKVPRQPIFLGVAANAVLVLTFFLAGFGSDRLLQGQPEISRVSLGGGFWIAVAGAYMAVFAGRQQLTNNRVTRELTSWGGLTIAAALVACGWLNHVSVLVEFSGYHDRFWHELLEHIRLFGGSVIVAAVIGVMLGIWATRSQAAERPVFFVTNVLQTIPSLALFGILIAPLSALSFAYPVLRNVGIMGVGAAPAVIALTIYSLLPIMQNTYTGIRHVEPAAIDAGLGMGMSRWQVFRRIEAPLAAPLVLEGIRTASVQAVGLTAVAALIGAGGLGWFVFQGIGQAAPDLIILGAIPIVVLALVVDGLMRGIVRLGTPKGLSDKGQAI